MERLELLVLHAVRSDDLADDELRVAADGDIILRVAVLGEPAEAFEESRVLADVVGRARSRRCSEAEPLLDGAAILLHEETVRGDAAGVHGLARTVEVEHRRGLYHEGLQLEGGEQRFHAASRRAFARRSPPPCASGRGRAEIPSPAEPAHARAHGHGNSDAHADKHAGVHSDEHANGDLHRHAH